MALDIHPPKSRLQELELAHAGEEELADIRHSNALTTDARKVKEGYFLNIQLIDALASISLSTTYDYMIDFQVYSANVTIQSELLGVLTCCMSASPGRST